MCLRTSRFSWPTPSDAEEHSEIYPSTISVLIFLMI